MILFILAIVDLYFMYLMIKYFDWHKNIKFVPKKPVKYEVITYDKKGHDDVIKIID